MEFLKNFLIPSEMPSRIILRHFHTTCLPCKIGNVLEMDIFQKWSSSRNGALPIMQLFLQWNSSRIGTLPEMKFFQKWNSSRNGTLPEVELFFLDYHLQTHNLTFLTSFSRFTCLLSLVYKIKGQITYPNLLDFS